MTQQKSALLTIISVKGADFILLYENFIYYISFLKPTVLIGLGWNPKVLD